jgi:hypothetical protein
VSLDSSSGTHIERLAKLSVALCRPLMAPRLAPQSSLVFIAFRSIGNRPSRISELAALAGPGLDRPPDRQFWLRRFGFPAGPAARDVERPPAATDSRVDRLWWDPRDQTWAIVPGQMASRSPYWWRSRPAQPQLAKRLRSAGRPVSALTLFGSGTSRWPSWQPESSASSYSEPIRDSRPCTTRPTRREHRGVQPGAVRAPGASGQPPAHRPRAACPADRRRRRGVITLSPARASA